MGKNIHVVAHSHWDREWYFTTSRSKIYLQYDLESVMTTLEENPGFTSFMLDGQSCLIDDYLAWNPDQAPRIKKLVEDHRLIIGPWYTQTDQMVVSGESIVRNMYYGMRRARDFGGYMNIGYVPDSFGQAGNMPQIYRQFGIDSTLFWRGVSDDMVKHTDFVWRGDDGSKVLASQIPNGYYIGGNIPEKPEDAKIFWDEQCDNKAGGRSATDNVYFPVGFDQAPIRTNLPELVAEQQKADQNNTYQISSLAEFISDLKAAADDLEEVDGELLCGKQMRIHRSIFSSRSDLKALNTEMQNYIVNIMEPILLISERLGNKYPHGAVDALWKLIFENAAHDSIGSSVNDSVNEDVYMRYKQAHDIAVNLVELHSRLIVTAMIDSENMHSITAFNTLPQKRSDILVQKMYLPGNSFSLTNASGKEIPYTILNKKDLTDYVLAQTIRLNPSQPIDIPQQVFEATVAIETKDLPAMGYRRFILKEGTSGEEPLTSCDHLENDFYSISVNQDGSLCVVSKEDGRVYAHEAVLLESGDDGDSFNYSPPRKDLIIRSTDFKHTTVIEGSSLYQRALISFNMLVPKNLEERAQSICSDNFPVTLEVILAKGAKAIGVNVHVDNTEPQSHRLCILFDAQITSAINYADEQFGCIVRENLHKNDMALYRESLGAPATPQAGDRGGMPVNWIQKEGSWQEPPVAIEPTQSYVALFDENSGLAVFPKGVREYEIVDDNLDSTGTGNIICLTLFRSYGFMGKENLLYRPGRASGEKTMATPAAQLQKQMTYELGFSTYASNFNDAKVAQTARAFTTPLQGYEYAPFLNGRLIFSQMEKTGTCADEATFLETKGSLIVSAIKKAEERPGLIVRLYNGNDHVETSDEITFSGEISYASYVNLFEQDCAAISYDAHSVRIDSIGHCKFVSIYVELKGQ